VERVRICFSAVRANSQGGQAGNWVMSLTWQCVCVWGGGVLRKRLSFWLYKFRLLPGIKSQFSTTLNRLYTNMLNRLKNGNMFLDKIIFSDEATFHISGKVTRHNLIIWGSQNLHQVVERLRNSPKVNVICAVSRTQVYGTFFLAESLCVLKCHYMIT
jgi:hypothetical protein